MQAEPFDAVLMDLGLPDIEGGVLLQRLREISDLPIIVVSGRGTEQDKVDALDLGADDFVAKPFLPGELLARLRAVLRRSAAFSRDAGTKTLQLVDKEEARPISLGTMKLDPTLRSLEVDGQTVRLTEGEYTILAVLIANPDKAITKAALLEALYGEGDARETKIVDVYISRIRQKLRQLGRDDVIMNYRGRGWSLTAPE